MVSKYSRGSNQFQKKNKNLWKKYLSIYLLIVVLACTVGAFKPTPKQVEAQTIISPIANNTIVEPASAGVQAPTPTPTVTAHRAVGTVQDQIRDDIKNVFGQYADKAFKLLSCENSSFNPNAKNVNSDQWNSTDWGVFQINDHWQGVSNKAFLQDPAINIRMAYNIFSRDGYSFKLWTCGRKLGI